MLSYHIFLKARGAHVPAQLRPDMSPVYKGAGILLYISGPWAGCRPISGLLIVNRLGPGCNVLNKSDQIQHITKVLGHTHLFGSEPLLRTHALVQGL